MTGKELIEWIRRNNLENAEIYLGVQGYMTTYNYDETLEADKFGNSIFLHDTCYYADLENAKKEEN